MNRDHGPETDPRLPAVYDVENRSSIEDAFFLSMVNLSPQSRVLDLGCGTGRLTLAMAAAGHVVTGVDPKKPHRDTRSLGAGCLDQRPRPGDVGGRPRPGCEPFSSVADRVLKALDRIAEAHPGQIVGRGIDMCLDVENAWSAPTSPVKGAAEALGRAEGGVW